LTVGVYLGFLAKIAGSIWMALGIAYGAVKTRGFQAELVTFDVPDEAEAAATSGA
jgi:hypothetical protein